jgi:hypothetical protein
MPTPVKRLCRQRCEGPRVCADASPEPANAMPSRHFSLGTPAAVVSTMESLLAVSTSSIAADQMKSVAISETQWADKHRHDQACEWTKIAWPPM